MVQVARKQAEHHLLRDGVRTADQMAVLGGAVPAHGGQDETRLVLATQAIAPGAGGGGRGKCGP